MRGFVSFPAFCGRMVRHQSVHKSWFSGSSGEFSFLEPVMRKHNCLDLLTLGLRETCQWMEQSCIEPWLEKIYKHDCSFLQIFLRERHWDTAHGYLPGDVSVPEACVMGKCDPALLCFGHWNQGCISTHSFPMRTLDSLFHTL